MFRFLPILLGICVAIVSGLIGAVGMRSLAHYEKVSATPTEMTFEQFNENQPEDICHYKLIDLRCGSNVYPEPIQPDGEWEKVYVCMFSNKTHSLGKNYNSIIAEIDGIKGIKELAEFLQGGSLDAHFWPNEQSLPDSVYNRMAQKYRGMRFDKCLHVQAGGPPPSPSFGNTCTWIGIGGISLSVLGVIGFYGLKLLGTFTSRHRDPWGDEDEDVITNKAGLPTA